MASYNSIGTYSAVSSYPSFKGLMQYGDGINTDPRYAVDAVNVETVGGVLQPAAACVLLAPKLAQPIKTLARLYRRWYTGTDNREVLVAASGGKLYYMLPGASSWTQLAFPTGVTAYQSDVWSWVAYEITAVIQTVWDPSMNYGKGDIAIIRWPIEAFLWDTKAEYLQDSRACIKVSWHTLSWYEAHYPDKAPYVNAEDGQHNEVGMPESQKDMLGEDEGRAMLLEYWYREYNAKSQPQRCIDQRHDRRSIQALTGQSCQREDLRHEKVRII